MSDVNKNSMLTAKLPNDIGPAEKRRSRGKDRQADHLFMGDRNVSMTYDPAFVAALNHSERIRQDIDLVTARINYRFGGPVIAKY